MSESIEQIEPSANQPAFQPEGSMAIAISRAAQEVQAAMVIAKKFPRNELEAQNRILQSCKRATLADAGIYSYPRGGSTVEGPSIRLAEEMARNWGNMDFGLIELEQRANESVAMAFAWDLQTNTRRSMIFTVPHVREVGRGANKTLKALDDPRDIYEIVANMGSRRTRACVLALIPGDIVELAVNQCNQTMADVDKGVSLTDRIGKMVAAFSDFGVTQDMIERKFAHRLSGTSEAELAQLRKIYRAIADGAASREQFFDLPATAERPPAPPKEPKGAAAAVAPERGERPLGPYPGLDAVVAVISPATSAEAPKPQAAPPAPADPAPVTRAAPPARAPAEAPVIDIASTPVADKKEIPTKLAAGTAVTATGKVLSVVALKINKQPSVKATVETDQYRGLVYHIGGAKVIRQVAQALGKVIDEMAPLPVWQLEKPVTMGLSAKAVTGQPDAIVFVEKIALVGQEEDGITF